MRVWDVDPGVLCRQHLLGEHREIHALFTVITQRRSGYARHPETARWRGHLPALRLRHARVAEEMRRRGYRHRSHIAPPRRSVIPPAPLLSIRDQRRRLAAKGCACRVGRSFARSLRPRV